MSSIEVSTVINVTPEEAWDSLYNIEERSKHLESFRGLEILENNEHSQIVRMDEVVDGKDVTVTSKFVFERPTYLAYEHIEPRPFGENHGRFDLIPHADGTEIRHQHHSEQDLDEQASLREDWIKMMHDMHATIELVALQSRSEA